MVYHQNKPLKVKVDYTAKVCGASLYSNSILSSNSSTSNLSTIEYFFLNQLKRVKYPPGKK